MGIFEICSGTSTPYFFVKKCTFQKLANGPPLRQGTFDHMFYQKSTCPPSHCRLKFSNNNSENMSGRKEVALSQYNT